MSDAVAVLVWYTDNSEEGDARDISSKGLAPEGAALQFGEEKWSDNDYPKEQEITVKDSDDVYHTFTVLAEPSVEFRVFRK